MGLNGRRLWPRCGLGLLHATVIVSLGGIASLAAAGRVGAAVLLHVVLARESLLAVGADCIFLAGVLLGVSCSVAGGGEVVLATELRCEGARVLILLRPGLRRRHWLPLGARGAHVGILDVGLLWVREARGHHGRRVHHGLLLVPGGLLREAAVVGRHLRMRRLRIEVVVGRAGRRRAHGRRVGGIAAEELGSLRREARRGSVARSTRTKTWL